MQKSAQYQAALEILEEIFSKKMPADQIVSNYMRTRKYIGSKDRRVIAETVWDIIRNKMKLSFDCGSSGARNLLLTYLKNEDFELLCGASEYGLKPLSEAEKKMLNTLSEEVYPPYIEAEMPKWLYEKIADDRLCKSLNEKAPADFRTNGCNRNDVIKNLQKEGLYFSKTPYSPLGIRSSDRININNCVAYREGKIEVQDEASQIVSVLCEPKSSQKIVDYCAGAGGKSLAIAALLDGRGKIIAHDINKKRLQAIYERMERLNIKNIEVRENISDNDFDKFILDAPCSGTGTFRRSPDAKYRLTEDKIADLNRAQNEVLEFAYAHTKKGGEIIYITCSVLRQENHDIINAFLQKHSDCKLINLKNRWQEKIANYFPFDDEHMLQFSPLNTQTDGFFMAALQKI